MPNMHLYSPDTEVFRAVVTYVYEDGTTSKAVTKCYTTRQAASGQGSVEVRHVTSGYKVWDPTAKVYRDVASATYVIEVCSEWETLLK